MVYLFLLFFLFVCFCPDVGLENKTKHNNVKCQNFPEGRNSAPGAASLAVLSQQLRALHTVVVLSTGTGRWPAWHSPGRGQSVFLGSFPGSQHC